KLKPLGLFSGDEFEAAQGYLEGRATRPESGTQGGQASETFDFLRSSLETLLCGVARALAADAATPGGPMPTKELFFELVEAIQKHDTERLDRLQEHWEQIGGYVEKNPDLAQGVRLSSEDQAALILWLSTPPPPRPIPWTELEEPRFLV